MPSLIPADIQADPQCISAQVTNPTGLPLTIRPLQPEDRYILGVYFLGLSEETKSWYGPHPFDQPTADRLCADIDYTQIIRLIGILPQAGDEQVVAYFILHLGIYPDEIERYARQNLRLDPQIDCLVAPSITDAWQNHGLGTLVMRHTLDVAHRLGRRRVALMGGVFVANQRAVHFYRKMGFRTISTFAEPNRPERPSYDMYLEIGEQGSEQGSGNL
jgi:GNAT superfamily N-acetyltransferase